MYLGQNEDCSLGDSRSDSLETARERQWGRSVYIRDFSEGGVHAIKRIFVQKVSTSFVELLQVMRNSRHHEGF